MASNGRLVITLSPYLKSKLETLADSFGTSQGEVLRIALVKLLKEEER